MRADSTHPRFSAMPIMELKKIKDFINTEEDIKFQCSSLGLVYEPENDLESDYRRRARIKGRIKTKLKRQWMNLVVMLWFSWYFFYNSTYFLSARTCPYLRWWQLYVYKDSIYFIRLVINTHSDTVVFFSIVNSSLIDFLLVAIQNFIWHLQSHVLGLVLSYNDAPY